MYCKTTKKLTQSEERSIMVSTRCGEYTPPEKTPPLPLPPPDKDDDNNNNGGEGVAVGESLNYDNDSTSGDDKERGQLSQ